MPSRQLEWQRKKLLQGLCRICGKRKLATISMCRSCADKRNVRQRKERRAERAARKLRDSDIADAAARLGGCIADAAARLGGW